MSKANPLLPCRTLLFRLSVPCKYRKLPKPGKSLWLPPAHRLPCLSRMEGRREFADVRLAWCEEGIVCSVQVTDKTKTPWCRETRAEESDGLQIWIDTRDTHDIHRASRFCHQFTFLPQGGGAGYLEPVAAQSLIHRAREHPRPVGERVLQLQSSPQKNGYRISGLIPASALSGFDPEEHPKIGFFYSVLDQELGCQTLSLGPELPVYEDPSLWASLELSR